MFTVIRQYRIASGSIEDVMHRVDEQFADQLAQEPGFMGYEVFEAGEGMLVSVTTFQDRQGGERSAELAAEFVRTALGDMDVQRIAMIGGEVMVSRARQELLEPLHA
jgi:hypothetical protein